MDVSETDGDVWIQRNSADLIADFERSLNPFLRQRDGQLRRRVRARETARLVERVLDPFQELPQLLDPHLPRFLPPLAEAYLELLQDRRRTRGLSTRSQLLMPLPNAIARVLYAFCKIRGEKVIVRFLNVETRYLEVLLYAIEASDRQPVTPDGQGEAASWTWHERYIVLLWLSQLFFAPFDLSTISSGEADDADRPVVPGFEWPERVPGIALRVIPLGLKFLASPGKERDGAKALLIRLAMRKDMQEIGILQALVHWSLSTLQSRKEGPADTPYFYIGSLAFLAGVLRAAADTSIMDPFLAPIYSAISAVAAGDDPTFEIIKGSALARKLMIKVIRCVVTLALRKPEPSEADSEIVESSIGYFLESLADNDTPVRLAASKALSIITLKLESDMALQVVEAILESLNKNVLWTKSRSSISGARMRDLTSVDPLEWHGLMLTLSHLLYRRSPPPESLSDIIHALIMGLEFEKRGMSGGSIGTNVRDAACFGIWALARRYSTAELLQVPIKSVATSEPGIAPKSVIQVIATELVVAACLDPAGNIRRGSSAALQELIGRHPDTVEEGIAVVQAVDYHSVALRSRAINEVSIRATQLSSQYGFALLDALLGWRGAGDMDGMARRVAAASFGSLTEKIGHATADPGSRVTASIDLLADKVRSLHTRQVEERHGLVLSLAAVFDIIPSLGGRDGDEGGFKRLPLRRFHDQLLEILEDCRATAYRKPELVAEAASRLVISSYPVLMADLLHPGQLAGPGGHECLRPGSAITACEDARVVTSAVSLLDGATAGDTSSLDKLMAVLLELVNTWLNNNDTQVMEASSQAALILLLFTPPRKRASIIVGWADKIRSSSASRNKHGTGFFQALTGSYHIALSCPGAVGVIDQITRALVERWTSDSDIDTHVAILRSLASRDLLRGRIHTFLPIIVEGLDDYTTNARGDVGSHVRLEAIKATKTLWASLMSKNPASDGTDNPTVTELYPRMIRLAAEKLDRVRVEAQLAVSMLLPSSSAETFCSLSFSSRGYFAYLFSLCQPESLGRSVAHSWTTSASENLLALLAGLSTSADTGNEDLVVASRAAVAEFCDGRPDHVAQVGTALVQNLKRYQGQDRVLVPTLELAAYLFHAGFLQQYEELNLRQVCLLTQKASYKTGNARKIEACIKVYGGVASVAVAADTAQTELGRKRQEGVIEAKKRLGALLLHPWPRVRTLVVDELWGCLTMMGKEGSQDPEAAVGQLLSVDWGKAEKAVIKKVVGQLGLD